MNHIKYFDRNIEGRDFFSTDLHGCYDLLHEKLREVAFDTTKDRLFSGGDWCDRGPDSKHVLDYLSEPWIHSVRANHEEMLIEAYENPYSRQAFEMLYFNGGSWFYEISDAEQKAIYEAFKSLPLGIEIAGKIGIVHAQVPYSDWSRFKEASRIELDYNCKAVAQWSRTKYDRKNDWQEVEGIEKVYVGHTPTDSGEIEKLANVYYCDLGSFFRNKISFIELEY